MNNTTNGPTTAGATTGTATCTTVKSDKTTADTTATDQKQSPTSKRKQMSLSSFLSSKKGKMNENGTTDSAGTSTTSTTSEVTGTTTNTGNRKRGPGKALTNDEKRDIERRVTMMVELHRPQGTMSKGTSFWIPKEGNDKQTPPAEGTWCEKREVKFPQQHEVYTCIGYEGLYKRLDDKPSNRTVKNNTSHIVVTKGPELRMVSVKCRDNNTGVKVRDEDGKLWHLVYLEKKEGYNTGADQKQPTQTQKSISSFFSLKEKSTK